MSAQPTIRIKGKAYDLPSTSKLGDPALIERLTDMTSVAWRKRYIAWMEGEEADELVNSVLVGLIVARAHPEWTRPEVVAYVQNLDDDEVEFVAGDTVPLAEGAEDAPAMPPSGPTPVEQSRSDSDMGSSESTTPPTSGTATSPTSPEEQSDQTTWAALPSISTSTS